jgi:hypothetical protein
MAGSNGLLVRLSPWMMPVPSMKRFLAIAVGILVLLLVTATILYKRLEHRRDLALAHMQAQFDVWHGTLQRLQHDLPVGTARAEVKRYLDSGRIVFNDGERITVNLGLVPGERFHLHYWSAHLSFEFRRLGEARLLPDAKLNNIYFKKFGHCL